MTARSAVQFIELDISYCSLSYGVAPCTASIPSTGTAKCFNSVATCQDSANYAASTVTLRFTEANDFRPLDIEALPNIASADFTPAKINPGEDLGTRASLRITLKDHPHSDAGPGYDKYHAERGYEPFRQGSWAGKLRARQPYLRGREVRWYQGYSDQTLDEMELRTFIVESFDGPSVSGIYSLLAVDPLKMFDGDRALAPALSNGRLSADITSSATSATLVPSGIGSAEYAASGYLAIGGSEIVSFTRSGDALTIVRGQLGTPAAEHKAADRVQTVLRYASMDPADIIDDLASNYAGVPSDWVPLADWQAETAAYLRREYTATIAEPTPVNQLVAELQQQAGLSLWWDDLGAKLRLRVLRSMQSSALALDSSNVLKGSFSRKEQPDKRLSQVWVFYGQTNPLKGQEETENYRSVVGVADLVNEANYGSASVRKIFSRWIAPGGLTAAQRVGDLLIGRYGRPPREFSLATMRDAQENPELGAAYNLQWRTEQLADGSAETIQAQVLQLKPAKDKFEIIAEEIPLTLDEEDLDNRQITVDFDALDLNMRSMHDALFPDPTDGMTVNFLIEEGVYVGASSTSIPALQTGTWPTKAVTGNRTSGSPTLTGIANTTGLVPGQLVTGTGIPAGSKILSIVTNTSITLDHNASSGSGTSTALTVYTVILNVIIRGFVYARGGTGGRGADGNGDHDGQNGGAGGTAFKVDYPLFLTDTDGTTGGGGGGGGGGPCRDANDHKGGGGGGGQGELGGDGGIGPGNGREGKAGSRTAAGVGGHGWTNNNFFAGPSDDGSRRGGNGGALGSAGQNGQGSSDLARGNGGAAGPSIDGISKVVTVGSAGTRLGSQIN